MPFRSKKQNAWAHTDEGEAALGGPDKVKEWESATDYSTLPEQAPSTPRKKKFTYAPKVKAGYSANQRLA
jgi:hypothetical protein